MDVLNKREKRLYKILKKHVEENGSMTVEAKDFPEWKSLFAKLKESGYISVIYADNAAFIGKASNFKQFEIEQKELKKDNRKISSHDYKVAIISSVIGAVLGSLLTLVITA